MSPRRDPYRPGGFWNPQDSPLSKVDADQYFHVGALVMGVGMLLIVLVVALLIRLESTSHHHRQIIIAAALLIVVSYAVTVRGGIKFGHGYQQGGRFQPRTVHVLWAAAEYYSCASAFLSAACVVVMAGAILLSSLPSGLWVVVAVALFNSLAFFWVWRFVRDRRRSLFPSSPASSLERARIGGFSRSIVWPI